MAIIISNQSTNSQSSGCKELNLPMFEASVIMLFGTLLCTTTTATLSFSGGGYLTIVFY